MPGFGGIGDSTLKIDFGGGQGSSPNMIVLIAAKLLTPGAGSDQVQVQFRFSDKTATERDFLVLAAALLRELQLRANGLARLKGREGTRLGPFADKAIDIALDAERNGKQAGNEQT